LKDFPQLDHKAMWDIARVIRHLKEDPNFLNQSPYPMDVRDWLVRQAAGGETSDVKLEDLETEAQTLFLQLKKLSKDVEAGTEVKDKLSYIKAATSLLDKLILLKERAADVKQQAKFQNTVLTLLEEICTPDQRTQVMERLKDYI
jgi:hypothetical protein